MRVRLAAASLLLTMLWAGAAHAHAFLDHASPLVGGTVAAAPHEVTLWFTQNIEPAFSRIAVSDSSGARVDQGKAQQEVVEALGISLATIKRYLAFAKFGHSRLPIGLPLSDTTRDYFDKWSASLAQ